MIDKKLKASIVFNLDELAEGFEETSLFQDVTNEIIQESIDGKYDKFDIKKAEDWNMLSNQIVGKETEGIK